MSHRGLLIILALILSATGALGQTTVCDVAPTNGMWLTGFAERDLSGNGYTGVYTAVTYTNRFGTNGAAQTFYGSGAEGTNLLRCIGPSVSGATSLTISAWVRRAQGPIDFGLVSLTGATGIFIQVWSDNNIYINADGIGGRYVYYTSAGTDWKHIVVVARLGAGGGNSNRMYVYEAGLQKTFNGSTALNTSLPTQTYYVVAGRIGGTASMGQFDDLMVYPGELSSNEVAQLHTRTHPTTYDWMWHTNYPTALLIWRVADCVPEIQPPAATARRKVGPIYNAWLMGGQR